MKKRIYASLTCFTIVALALNVPAVAQQTAQADKYSSIAEIPAPLLRTLRSSDASYEEKYIASMLDNLRRNSRTKNSLDRQDIDNLLKKEIDSRRREHFISLVRYDLNFDGRVTRDEIKETLSQTEHYDRRINDIMKADKDGDGILTLKEMSALPEEQHAHSDSKINSLAELLALDPDHDGKLTAIELESLAHKVYRTVDENSDGTLSQDELQAVQDISRRNASPIQKKNLLTIKTEAGMEKDAGFKTAGPGNPAEGTERKFIVEWNGSKDVGAPVIKLEQGDAYKISLEDCTKHLINEGHCNIHVQMIPSANGLFHDRLVISVDNQSAKIDISGTAKGWAESQIVLDSPPPNTPFIIVKGNTANNSDTKSFILRNAGSGPSKPLNLKVTDMAGGAKKTWEILPTSTCLTNYIMPGATCSITVIAKPDMDGQMLGYMDLAAKSGDFLSRIEIYGYARGIKGKLPPQVIGNGDSCPIVGQHAEIAVSGTGGFRSNDGYFNRRYNHGDTLQLVTAECDHWEEREKGYMTCNNPGSGAHGATMHEYQSFSFDGPWQPTRVEERNISATLVCRSGIIDQINWTW